jgi:autotransporter-associated beta strand protein
MALTVPGPRNFVTTNDLVCSGGVNTSGGSIVKSGLGTLTLSGTTDNSFCAVTNNQGTVILAKASTGTVAALGGDTTVNTNGTLVFSGTGGNQVFSGASIILNGGKLQMQETNLEEEIKMLRGMNPVSIVENGLLNSTNRLRVGGGRNSHGIYGGILRDGSAGVLEFADTLSGNWIVLTGTNNTYSGQTIVNGNDGTGTSPTRLIVDGVHIGVGAYNVSGRAAVPANQGVVGGKGIIAAGAMNFGANTALSPGGALSSEANTATFSDTTAILTISNTVNLATATSTLDVQLNGTIAGTSYDQVNIAGSGIFSNNSGNLKITLGYSPAVGDKFTIVKVQGTNPTNNVGVFSTLNGVATDLSQGATFVEPSSGKNMHISYRAEGSTFDAGAGNGNDIMLEVLAAPGANLTWRGDVNSAWDITTTANWRTSGGAAITFTNNDNVTFNNSGSNAAPIDLTTDLTPGNIIFDSTNDYVFATSAAGKLTGTVVLTKTNTGTLSIVTDNNNNGTTIINQGKLQIGTNGTSGTLSGALTINPNGVLAHNRSDDVTFATVLTGAGSFLHTGSGALILSVDSPSFAGRTTNSGGALQLGTGGTVGSIAGDVNVGATNLLHYYYGGDATIGNTRSGNGTIIYEAASGNRTFTIPTTTVSSNFTGTNILTAGVRLHASDNNSGNAFGNGGLISVPQYAQAWCDRSATVYNQEFDIAGQGWVGVSPASGAISVFGCTLTGPIHLLDNARIGGTISGGTINGQISGNYQLEVWGNSGSYVLSLGPTNGINSYASTLITSGSILALNTNAISTGPLTMDLAGDLRLNGNNLTVSDLSSINAQSFTNAGATIQNIGATPATLTVGADNTSTEFDGFFLDGGAAPLGLTKVGTGTLTLTGASTDTGTVAVKGGTLMLTGSGSFNNASTIAVGSNTTYDVAGTSNPLTLNSGQTLTGSGTVSGSVSASAGSVINPGDSIGALTITGNATLAGGLLMELNRTNSSATNDSLIVNGTLTESGTLTVKNLGPALHVGDKFYLFSHAVIGFSATNLPTTDAVNGYAYTWTNNIGLDGSIQVLTAAPAIANFWFRSFTNGNWSDASTWQQSTNGVNWVNAVGTPDYTASNVLIQTGHTVTNLLAVTVDHVTVQTNATVLLTTGNLTITNSTAAIDFLVAGTLNVGAGSGLVNNSGSAVLVFTNGGAFVWNRASIPAIPTATWRDGSTCRISAMATGYVGNMSGQSYYDFIWDTTVAGQASRGRLGILGTYTVIRRDFTVTIPNTSGASMTINRETNGVLTVGRNVSLNGGLASSGIKILLNDAAGDTNLFKVGGNFTATGYIDGFGNASTLFDFNGTGTQSLTLPSSTFILTPAAINWQVEAGSTMTLASSIQAFNSFTNNGTLTFGANTISGGTNLVLNSGGTVNGNGTNKLVSGMASIVNGGTLNLGSLPTFAGGESFTLFSASSYSGTFGTLLPATPDGTHTWVTTQLNTAGILAVSGGVNTNAPQIQVSITGNVLSLAWPTNKGWTLLTNSVGLTATSQWFPYPNSANLTNVNVTMDPSKTNVFFKMQYPYP